MPTPVVLLLPPEAELVSDGHLPMTPPLRKLGVSPFSPSGPTESSLARPKSPSRTDTRAPSSRTTKTWPLQGTQSQMWP